MQTLQSRPVLSWILAVGLLLALGVVAPLLAKTSGEEVAAADAPVTRAQAEKVLADVVELVERREFDKLCSAAWARGMCESLLNSAEIQGRYPGQEPPVVIGAERSKGDLVLRLRVTDSAPETFEADFPVIRNYRGDLVAQLPIYWAGANGGS